MGELVRIHAQQALSADDIAARLKRMASILTAIDAGELLSGLPECPAERANHAVALDLLGILEAEIQALSAEFEGGGVAADR